MVLLFVVTYSLDRAAYDGLIQFPPWVISGTADVARVLLATVAAAIITVVGIVFSITIVALTLASTQFGPRMLRNFVRDPGTQLSLGTFVASFCYAMISLVSVGGGPHGDFVPHLSITVTLLFTLFDVAVLIYFLNHIATMIQLPVVIANIATTLVSEVTAMESSDVGPVGTAPRPVPRRTASSDWPKTAPRSAHRAVVTSKSSAMTSW